MASDAALLALIVDDDRALHVLAAWGAIEPQLADIGSAELIARLVELVAVSEESVRRSLARLAAARVLIDGGISDLADRLLQTRVQTAMTGRKK